MVFLSLLTARWGQIDLILWWLIVIHKFTSLCSVQRRGHGRRSCLVFAIRMFVCAQMMRMKFISILLDLIISYANH